jgi:hypothetical protein
MRKEEVQQTKKEEKERDRERSDGQGRGTGGGGNVDDEHIYTFHSTIYLKELKKN